MKGFRAKTAGEREGFYQPGQGAAAYNGYYRGARAAAKAWKGCETCPPERRDPKAPLEVHHVIPQSVLHRVAAERRWSALKKLRALTDARNSLVICEREHSRHTNRIQRIGRDQLPNRALAFVRDYDLWVELQAEYPN